MGFFDDFWTGFKSPFEMVYDHGIKPGLNILDKASGAAGNIIGAAGNIAQGAGSAALGLGDLLSGNSNILIYLGFGIVAVAVLSTLINKLL